MIFGAHFFLSGAKFMAGQLEGLAAGSETGARNDDVEKPGTPSYWMLRSLADPWLWWHSAGARMVPAKDSGDILQAHLTAIQRTVFYRFHRSLS